MLETITITSFVAGLVVGALIILGVTIIRAKTKTFDDSFRSKQQEGSKIVNYPNFSVPGERPYWNTTLGGGYYGTRGWPFWAYLTGFPYGECSQPCGCSTPFKCEEAENKTCPTFSTCSYN